MYLVFTRIPGESYRRRLRSLVLYLRYVFRALSNSLVCWFCMHLGNHLRGWGCMLRWRGGRRRGGGVACFSNSKTCILFAFNFFCSVLFQHKKSESYNFAFSNPATDTRREKNDVDASAKCRLLVFNCRLFMSRCQKRDWRGSVLFPDLSRSEGVFFSCLGPQLNATMTRFMETMICLLCREVKWVQICNPRWAVDFCLDLLLWS